MDVNVDIKIEHTTKNNKVEQIKINMGVNGCKLQPILVD